MLVRFWGTRGSIATPGPSTVRYGGNTSCVEVRTDDGTLIVLDCGTGARPLGNALTAETAGPIRGHLFFSHTHWDHIQGFPFFAPLFVPGNEWDIYAPGGLGRRLETTLAQQMEYTFFPVAVEQLGATLRYHDLGEGTVDLGSVRVTCRYLNHPALTLGYRIEAGGAAVVYATDHEPHRGPASDGEPPVELGHFSAHQEDQHHGAFLAGADLVIHDAQYTTAEYAQKIGWGHSTIDYAVEVARSARVKQLVLYHHDPARDDDAVDELVDGYRQRLAGTGLELRAAAEGLAIEVPECIEQPARVIRSVSAGHRLAPPRDLRRQPSILVVDQDPDVIRKLLSILQPESFQILTASDGTAALALAQAERPRLILLDSQLPGADGLSVCRQIRGLADPMLRDVPIVLLAGRAGTEHTADAFAAGATDYLLKPFTPAHVRSRVRGWLLRTSATAAQPA